MTGDNPPILVAACGNLMAADDAFGPLVARRLRDSPPQNAEIIDLGMKPTGLLDHLDGRRASIIVDAAISNSEFPVGSLVDMDFFSPDRPELVHDMPLSSHGLSIAHELELARKLEMLPRHVMLVAAAIDDASVGGAVGRRIEALVQPAADRIRDLIELMG
jgi:hydrogenase maturation protease